MSDKANSVASEYYRVECLRLAVSTGQTDRVRLMELAREMYDWVMGGK